MMAWAFFVRSGVEGARGGCSAEGRVHGWGQGDGVAMGYPAPLQFPSAASPRGRVSEPVRVPGGWRGENCWGGR